MSVLLLLKKAPVIFIVLVLNTLTLEAQAPEIEWDQTIGGTRSEFPTKIIKTTNGGVIICGYSQSSISPDKSEGVIGGGSFIYDYWVIKLDSNGIIEWENTIGGSANDYLYTAIETEDGGYLLGGLSGSEISGDKTTPQLGGGDIWLLKIDTLGNILWQKNYGGTGEDKISSIIKTNNGNYVIGASSTSGISGNKTEVNYGVNDYWIFEIDNLGNILWQNTIGGSTLDELKSISLTQDNGFIICGYSLSSISGEKTENIIGTPGLIGDGDFWVLKLDSIGNIIWQNTIGGSDTDRPANVFELQDGSYLCFGYSDSDSSGDKTSDVLGGILPALDQDIWIIKLNSDGEVLWDKTIGGSDGDNLDRVVKAENGMFYLICNSLSPISFDKTKPLVAKRDTWLLKVDSNANIIWQIDIGGSSDEQYGELCILDDGSLVSACGSQSGISGNKSEPLIGLYDIWIVKFGPDDCIPQPYYFDYDHDGVGNGDPLPNACELPIPNTAFLFGDCDTLWGAINSYQPEICDGYDNDCNGLIDEDIIICNSGPLIEWENTIGGNMNDNLNAACLTDDGGIILACESYSGIGADKTVSTGVDEYWIVKLYADGNIEWQKSFGTNQQDIVESIALTNDGGYIVAGNTGGGINGDKTDPSNGLTDYWVLKLNHLGEIEWQNGIGGSLADYMRAIIPTSDGGYLLGGNSKSPISGDKTEGVYGVQDIWIVKLNSSGNIEWQNTLGGAGSEYLMSLVQNDDGTYLISSSTNSGISADKAEPNFGLEDTWLVKIDATGNIIWENTIGGAGFDNPYATLKLDDGYLIGIESSSNISADKTTNSFGYSDVWLIKVNQFGEILWQKLYGGSNYDDIKSIKQTSDGGYLLGCNSVSPVSGNKYTQSFYNDYWVIKIDSAGNKIWERSVGAVDNDRLVGAFQTNDNKYILAGLSNSNNTGYKSEPNKVVGPYYSTDMWIVKLFPDCEPTLELCNAIDDNCNGLIDEDISVTISIAAGGPTTFCQGGNVLLTATYSGATVQWKKNGTNIPGATSPTYLVTTKATYTCVTTSACGTATSTGIFVNVNKNPTATITAGGPTTFCAGGSVILTANAGAGLSYQWYKGASLIAGATAINYTATIPGNYKCRVTKTATGCFKNSNAISVSVTCKEDGELVQDIQLYPNPANDQVFIQTASSSIKKITVMNDIGQEITTLISSEELININIADYPQGMYLVEIIDNGFISSITFLKQ